MYRLRLMIILLSFVFKDHLSEGSITGLPLHPWSLSAVGIEVEFLPLLQAFHWTHPPCL